MTVVAKPVVIDSQKGFLYDYGAKIYAIFMLSDQTWDSNFISICDCMLGSEMEMEYFYLLSSSVIEFGLKIFLFRGLPFLAYFHH